MITVLPEADMSYDERGGEAEGHTDGVGRDPPPDTDAVLDWSVLATLREMERSSQPGSLNAIIALYLEEVPALLAALQEAVALGDAGRVQELAHRLRGGSVQLGAMRMARLSTALQEAGARRDLGQAAEQIAALQREFFQVHAGLTAVLSGADPS
ncbi:MAG TPA: Hpt domain-containing protein [Chloroflexota bacterium]|nr:Hpt domain-containing protein [Chloroflexota bacterium]